MNRRINTILFGFASITLCHTSMIAMCVDAASTSVYQATAELQYTMGDIQIGNTIQQITNIIKNEITKTEKDSNKLLNQIKLLQENQTLSVLKRNFILKQGNELQSISNDVKSQ